MTDEIQNQDQPTEGIPFCWVTFADDSQQKIASAHSGPIPRSSEEIKLPANDPRVLALMDPPETHRIIKWRIHDLDQLSKLAYLFDTGMPKPVYRGQSNYAWSLETRLARVAPISDSVIGGMLTSKCAITQANRTYIFERESPVG